MSEKLPGTRCRPGGASCAYKQADGSCGTCAVPPLPPPPSPEPPPPPPPPPACRWEGQRSWPKQCGDEGAIDKETCAKHFYKKKNGERRQCIWKKSSEGGALGCSAGGFKCVIKNEGNANCKCEATCPQQLPFVKEAVGSNCKFQNASKGNCARCCPYRHCTAIRICYMRVHYIRLTRAIYVPPASSTRPD